MQIANLLQVFRESQRFFHDAVVDNLQALKDAPSLLSFFTLTLVGFVYGALHAVGPGHGKVVVSGYMLANEHSLKRGLWVVALSSLLQGLVAIILVLSFFFLLNLARAEAERATAVLEVVSYALICLIGGSLALRGIKELRHHGAHDHTHCTHTHAPAPQNIKHGFWPMTVMIFSIGMRPCTGAVFMLFFACILGVVWQGVAAVMAMAVGTGLTTGLIATLTVKSRDAALRLVKTTDHGFAIAYALLSLFGGIAILLLSGIFLIETWNSQLAASAPPAPHPLMRF